MLGTSPSCRRWVTTSAERHRLHRKLPEFASPSDALEPTYVNSKMGKMYMKDEPVSEAGRVEEMTLQLPDYEESVLTDLIIEDAEMEISPHNSSLSPEHSASEESAGCTALDVGQLGAFQRPYIFCATSDDVLQHDYSIASSFVENVASLISASSSSSYTPVRSFVGVNVPPSTPLFIEKKLLGEGSFGKITKARYINGMNVAIKTITKRTDSSAFTATDKGVMVSPEGMLDEQIRETVIHSSLEPHCNVVSLYGCIETPKTINLLLECVEGGDLEQELQIKFRLSPPVVAVIAHQLFAALTHIHKGGVAHLDIKPANILLLKRGAELEQFALERGSQTDLPVLKLCDFGHSRVVCRQQVKVSRRHTVDCSTDCDAQQYLPTTKFRSHSVIGCAQRRDDMMVSAAASAVQFALNGNYDGTQVLGMGTGICSDSSDSLEVEHHEDVGTEGYLSPELLKHEERDGRLVKVVTLATDIWAAGACLYRCCTGQLPFRPARQCLNHDLVAKMSKEKVLSYIGCSPNRGACTPTYGTGASVPGTPTMTRGSPRSPVRTLVPSFDEQEQEAEHQFLAAVREYDHEFAELSLDSQSMGTENADADTDVAIEVCSICKTHDCSLSHHCALLIEKMLRIDPAHRMSAEEAFGYLDGHLNVSR